MSGRSKGLIISSGDISDVDGLYAVAKYATTGYDVLFVMNYPAYLNESDDVGILGAGLGYRYDTASFLDEFERNSKINHETPCYVKYNALLNIIYQDIKNISDRVKQILTDMAYSMVSRTWGDMNVTGKGELYFCIGGVNTFNPFSKSALKNEIYVYSDLMAVIKTDAYSQNVVYTNMNKLPSRNEGVLFKRILAAMAPIPEKCTRIDTPIPDFIALYPEIYVDFNGSMAFFNSEWERALEACTGKIKGAFVMGGVFSYAVPGTLPSMKNILNRFSCATMNQLYHSSNTARFFRMLGTLDIGVYVVCNNAVGSQATADSGRPTNDGWLLFLNTNFTRGYSYAQLSDGGTSVLQQLANAFYNCAYAPPRRAFDFYTAVALVSRMSSLDTGSDANLFFDSVYGVVLVSKKTSKQDAVNEYVSNINVTPDAEDSDFIRAKKENFKTELDVLQNSVSCEMISIHNVEFSDKAGERLVIKRQARPFELRLSIYYYEADSDHLTSIAVKRITGEDLFQSPQKRLYLTIKFDINNKPTVLVLPNGITWNRVGDTNANWDTFLKYNSERPAQTKATIDEFYSDTIELTLQAIGPYETYEHDDITPSVSHTVTFGSR